MLSNKYYTLNIDKLVFERFEDETVLINLESGNYYGIMQVGKEILDLLELGIDVKMIVSIISKAYKVDEKMVELDVTEFLTTLKEEAIIYEIEAKSVNYPVWQDKGAYVKPILEKYTDMQDLILLDPVHDVNSKGWPHKKDETK
jgi:hypothetical protein